MSGHPSATDRYDSSLRAFPLLSCPAAPCGVRVVSSCFSPHPDEGWMERRQAHSLVCRACEARPPSLAARPVPLRTGPLSALHHGDFRPGTHAAASGSLETGAASDLSATGQGPGGGVPDLPRCGSRRSRGTRLPAPSSGSSPEGDDPSVDGYEIPC
jgi:hypothetical protein